MKNKEPLFFEPIFPHVDLFSFWDYYGLKVCKKITLQSLAHRRALALKKRSQTWIFLVFNSDFRSYFFV